jgi:hypothetical protein
MDDLELIRAFRRDAPAPSPMGRAAARDRLVAHVGAAQYGPAAGGRSGRPKDEQEVYRWIGSLLTDLFANDFWELRQADTILQISLRNPKAQITLKLKPGEAGQVDFGSTDLVPEIVMTMDTALAHNFVLGKVNVTVALARGQMRARGPVSKILKLLPLTKPVFPRYRALLEQADPPRVVDLMS